MRNQRVIASGVASFVALLVVTACVLFSVPRVSTAHTVGDSITVTNNSGRNIQHVYLSAPNADNWGADQLNDAILGSGQSFTMSNVSCSGGATKVIAEDTDGCFVSAVVTCSANAGWTIGSEAPNCGN